MNCILVVQCIVMQVITTKLYIHYSAEADEFIAWKYIFCLGRFPLVLMSFSPNSNE